MMISTPSAFIITSMGSDGRGFRSSRTAWCSGVLPSRLWSLVLTIRVDIAFSFQERCVLQRHKPPQLLLKGPSRRLPISPYWKRFALGCPRSFVMKDHQSRHEAQPVLGCVVPGMKRQRDSHIAKKRVAGIGEFDRFGISEPPTGVLAHLGELHWFHWYCPWSGMLLTPLPPSTAADEGERVKASS